MNRRESLTKIITRVANYKPYTVTSASV